MKVKLLLLSSLIFSTFGFAQNSINYKALVKDDLGTPIANQQITVQFQILESGTTNVYQETHTPTTDNNGIIIVNIGEGVVDSGNFSMINWASASHFLNVQIDSGNGLVDLGTTQFGTVPYALNAQSATTSADNTNFREVYLNASTSPVTETKLPDLLIKLDPSIGLQTSAPIDQQKLLDLCGDDEGCKITITLFYANGSSAPNFKNSVSGMFYYVQNPNNVTQYNYSFVPTGSTSALNNTDNNGNQLAIINAFNACFLIDGSYTQGTLNGDNELGLSFLYWTGFGTNKECYCKIED